MLQKLIHNIETYELYNIQLRQIVAADQNEWCKIFRQTRCLSLKTNDVSFLEIRFTIVIRLRGDLRDRCGVKNILKFA